MSELFNPNDFYHRVHFVVWFRDLDVMGHVNNGTYLSYLEHARLSYARDIFGWNGNMHDLGMILGRVTMEYRSPLLFGEHVQILSRISRLGSKSFDMLHILQRIHEEAAPEIVATSITNMVAYSYTAAATIEIPTEWRTRIVAFEQALAK